MTFFPWTLDIWLVVVLCVAAGQLVKLAADNEW